MPAARLWKAKADPGSNKLVKAVVAEYETPEGRSSVQEGLRKLLAGSKPADAVQRSLANLREVSAILAAKAPGDAPAFKAGMKHRKTSMQFCANLLFETVGRCS